MTNAILRGKPDAGNPHVRFDEGEVASAKPRRGSLLYNAETLAVERTFATPEAIWCNNGLAWWDGSWWVISSSPQGFEYNILVEHDENFVYRETHLVKPNCRG